jgi:hypothetical protein
VRVILFKAIDLHETNGLLRMTLQATVPMQKTTDLAWQV